MWEIRQQIKELLEELNLTQRWLCIQINDSKRGYHVNPTEVSNALNGVMVSPKAKKIVTDSFVILTEEKEKTCRPI